MTSRPLPITSVPDGLALSEDVLPKLPIPKFTIEYVTTDLEESAKTPEGFKQCKLLKTRLLTSNNAVKPVYSFVLDAPGHHYLPGDSFDVICENSDARVEDLIGKLKLDPTLKIMIRGEHSQSGLLLSLRTLFKRHLDINQFPKKVFLRHLAEFAHDPSEKAALLYLSSRLGSAQYMALAKEYANLGDFLSTFSSCVPTLECVLMHSAPLMPRAYSACSYESDRVEFICSIDSYTTPEPNSQKRLGVCSEYLLEFAKTTENAQLWVCARPATSMRFPQEYRPMIMICAGAGLSPFLGFLRYAASVKIKLEDSWLFYGFRSLEDDFLFREELEGYQREGILGNLNVAVSRHPLNPRYVQDVLREKAGDVFRLMQDKQARIYLCGDEMTMIKSVNECLEWMCVEHGAGKVLLSEWTREKRIIRDIWV